MYAIVYHRVRDMTNADSRVCRKRVDVSLSRSIDSFASRDRGVAIVARLSFINEGPRLLRASDWGGSEAGVRSVTTSNSEASSERLRRE